MTLGPAIKFLEGCYLQIKGPSNIQNATAMKVLLLAGTLFKLPDVQYMVGSFPETGLFSNDRNTCCSSNALPAHRGDTEVSKQMSTRATTAGLETPSCVKEIELDKRRAQGAGAARCHERPRPPRHHRRHARPQGRPALQLWCPPCTSSFTPKTWKRKPFESLVSLLRKPPG